MGVIDVGAGLVSIKRTESKIITSPGSDASALLANNDFFLLPAALLIALGELFKAPQFAADRSN